MVTYTDRLFKFIVKASTTVELRLMMETRAKQAAYDHHEIDDVGWVKSEDNLADGITKGWKVRTPC